MDRLTRYLVENYSNLLTPQEHAAWRAIQFTEKATNSNSQGAAVILLDKAKALRNKSVQTLLDGGPEAFFCRLRERLMEEHLENIVLNHCPRCGGLARTPLARQCADCFHSWHECNDP